MKRAVFEWCGLGFTVLSVACFAYWIVSVATPVADFELTFGQQRPTMQVLATNGEITLCDAIGNLEVRELINNSVPFEPAPSKIYDGGMRGFHFSLITFDGGPPIWSLRMSLLIPSAIMIAFGGYWLHRYRLIRRAMAAPSSGGA